MGKIIEKKFLETDLSFWGVSYKVPSHFLTKILLEEKIKDGIAEVVTNLPRWQKDGYNSHFELCIKLKVNLENFSKYEAAYDNLLKTLRDAFSKIKVIRHDDSNTINIGTPNAIAKANDHSLAETHHDIAVKILLKY